MEPHDPRTGPKAEKTKGVSGMYEYDVAIVNRGLEPLTQEQAVHLAEEGEVVFVRAFDGRQLVASVRVEQQHDGTFALWGDGEGGRIETAEKAIDLAVACCEIVTDQYLASPERDEDEEDEDWA